MGKSLLVAGATLVAAAVLLFGARVLGTTSAAFAFLVVWSPMTWLGTVSRIIQPRLPRRYQELRDFERDPRLYELLGVRLVKRLLRRGPLAGFNPGLHLPAEPSPERLAELEQRMKDAEASHLILLVATLGVVINAVAQGWWLAAALTLLFDVLYERLPGHAAALQPRPPARTLPDRRGRRAWSVRGHLPVGPLDQGLSTQDCRRLSTVFHRLLPPRRGRSHFPFGPTMLPIASAPDQTALGALRGRSAVPERAAENVGRAAATRPWPTCRSGRTGLARRTLASGRLPDTGSVRTRRPVRPPHIAGRSIRPSTHHATAWAVATRRVAVL